MTRTGALAFTLMATAAAATSSSIEPRAPVERIAKLIEDNYFDPAAAARVAAALRSDLEAGKFDSLRDPRELAAVLTDRLSREDAHFSVAWTPPFEATSAPSPAPVVDGGAPLRENHGFRRVEVLPGNVGLIELTLLGHFEPDQPLAGSAREVADAALSLVARTQALIIDLRDCRGGSPSMVGYLVGHFVAADADVYNTFKSRGPDRYERPSVPIPEPRRLDLPLFVVVSGRTGSGAESVAYTLQAAKRATVVGERTAGGANPGDVYPVGDGLSIFISNGSPVNPITRKNWEGSGVGPDRVVTAAQAETAAYELALEAVLARTSPGLAADEARWSFDAVRAARDAEPLDEKERARYTAEFGARAIRDLGGELIYTFDRRPPRRLVRLSDDIFTLDGAPYTRLELERDSNGAVTALVVRQVSGSVARFPRTSAAAGR